MGVSWFTVIAQVINFFILVWLLKRFLYKPILKAIDTRESKINTELNEAEAKQAEAQKEQLEYKEKNEELSQQKKEVMDRAIAEAEEEREKLIEAARSEAIKLKNKLEKASAEEQRNLNLKIAQKTQQEVFAISRKVLNDLASLSLEEQSVHIFIKRIKELKEEEKKKLKQTLSSNLKSITIQSAFELPAKQQTGIKKAVEEIIGAKVSFEFKTMPDIVSGIELVANGFKLSWSISEYLNSLERNVSKTKEEKSKVESK